MGTPQIKQTMTGGVIGIRYHRSSGMAQAVIGHRTLSVTLQISIHIFLKTQRMSRVRVSYVPILAQVRKADLRFGSRLLES